MNECPFCAAFAGQPDSAEAMVLADGFPVSPGHRLVVPRRHVASYLELAAGERRMLWDLVDDTLARLGEELSPDGFNVGVNVGPAAGQTVGHVHIHVIPRYTGDMPDPRGGVRHVIPDKARYW